jgi:trans-aconitate 2-methyltransferase
MPTAPLDSMLRNATDARRNHGFELEFQVHDIVRAPFPVPAPDILVCRFLLTHLSSPGEVLATWASIAAPGSLLFIHETESLDTDHPTLRRYYELLAQLRRHCAHGVTTNMPGGLLI